MTFFFRVCEDQVIVRMFGPFWSLQTVKYVVTYTTDMQLNPIKASKLSAGTRKGVQLATLLRAY